MEWKNRTLRSMLKGNKEKVLFLFCSGLLLFVISLPDSGKTIQELPYALLEFGAEWDVCVRAKEWARHSEFDAEKLYVGVWMVNG